MKKILLSSILSVFVMHLFAVTHTVNSGNFYYTPSMLTVNVNDTVVWVNDGGYHNVNFDISTITGQSFNNPVSFSSAATNGATLYTYVFTVPGTYIYDCSVGSHAAMGMVGTVQVNSGSNPLVGTWKLAQIAGAMSVGPNQGDGSWWSNSIGDVASRACMFDDSITFDASGGFTHYMDGNTWVEQWQDGTGDGCRAPVAPHVGGSFNYTYSNGVLNVVGLGAHLGLPKVTNTGEINSPANAASAVSYVVSLSPNGDTMTADIDFGGGWWRFIYQKTSLTAVQPNTYDVTFHVNTSSITVGPNGLYAGGGVLGDAMAVSLTDPDGDGIYSGVGTFPAAGGNYVFLNSPSNGGDWGAKEDLNGLPCADPSNWNDRIMPSLTSDSTVLACFGSCETDGSCPGSANPVSITYEVDINDYLAGGNTLAPNGIRIAGDFGTNGALSSGLSMVDWNPTDISGAMSDPDGDNIWSITIDYGSSTTGTQYYKFVNGDWGGDESVSDTVCGGAGGFGSDRFFNIPLNDTTVCYKWGNCSSCGSQPSSGDSLTLTGIMDFTVPAGGASGKAIHLTAVQNISDLSIFGIGVANNGGGTDGQEYTFPSISINAGENILLARDTAEMSMYFDSCFANFHHVILASSSISQNGDDAIELFKNGNVIETFGDINVDGTGEPWEYMDSWAFKLGPTVGSPGPTSFSGFDWSFGAVNCTDGSTNTFNSTCPYPICTPPPPPPMINITFTLNTQTIAGNIDSTGMFIAGGGTFGNPGDNPMTDIGGGIWSITFSKPVGFTSDYTFTNGNSGWGAKENISGLPCAVAPWDDRNLAPVYSDTTIQHCFGTCDYDGTCNSAVSTVNVTFQVDMSQVIDPFVAPELNGTFNGWCGNCDQMSDADGDSIWDVNIQLNAGSIVEYKFSADSWGIQEMLDPSYACTNGDSVYTNRVLNVPNSDTILGVVCWGSCEPCIVTPPSGIDEIIHDVSIYPNPSNNYIIISSSEIIEKIEILDIVGKVIKTQNLSESSTTIDVSDLKNNVYFLTYSINGIVNSKKIIINH